MPDIIHLLSDHLANQIAAGEVIQRPASAVKELLENSIDAGASEMQLILRQAGKELIQVIDDGKGMSPADARMSFERHATSKIRDINDLFHINTKGFRGEALASIAAVAQVEMRTRQEDKEIGVRLVIEGTELKVNEGCATPVGTSIMVKNLFFNVPARRHFLKSNNTEYRHIIDEFTRVALAHPECSFRVIHDGDEKFRLEKGNLKTRVVQLLGNNYERNLVPVEEITEALTVHGFIGKPDAASKTRGAQFFFVNGRYIRNAYLHHALMTAYEGLITKDSFPFYVLFLEVDPQRVDVNVHPTKQEVKFEDDRLMYAYLSAAVKHALARYNIAPSLDFTLNADIQSLPSVQLPQQEAQIERTSRSYLHQSFTAPNQAHLIPRKDDLANWQEFYKIASAISDNHSDREFPSAPGQISMPIAGSEASEFTEQSGGQTPLLLQGTMLISTVKSGIMLIHVQRAMERIWHERLQERISRSDTSSQALLYPFNIELPAADAALLSEALPGLRRMGFDIAPFGHNTFTIQGVPPELSVGMEREALEEITEHLKHAAALPEMRMQEELITILSRRLARNANVQQYDLRQRLIDELFACSSPEYTPGGKKIFSLVIKEDLDKWLV